VITVSSEAGVITLINVFTVEPANQRRLVELLTEATEGAVRRALGFVSASLHRAQTAQRSRCMRSGEASMTIRRCPKTLAHFRFFKRRSGSPSLNLPSTRWCEPSHPPASRIETMRLRPLCAAMSGHSIVVIMRKFLLLPLRRTPEYVLFSG
jgi:hypothetical protein